MMGAGVNFIKLIFLGLLFIISIGIVVTMKFMMGKVLFSFVAIFVIYLIIRLTENENW